MLLVIGSSLQQATILQPRAVLPYFRLINRIAIRSISSYSCVLKHSSRPFLRNFHSITVHKSPNSSSSLNDNIKYILPYPQIKKPEIDKRLYSIIELNNGLEALLIHDDETSKSSVAVSINSGSFQDPKDHPGIAHLCEHLFTMSDHLEENQLGTLLSQHGGVMNAFTTTRETNYFYDVQNSGFLESWKLFNSCFHAHDFTDGNIAKEIHVIESEYIKNKACPHWRLEQVERELCNESSPYYQNFTCGNIESLSREGTKESVLSYYKENYIASNMKIVLLSKEPLDSMVTLISDAFGGLEKVDRSEMSFPPPFSASTTNKLIKVKHECHKSEVILQFPFEDDPISAGEVTPTEYFTHLLETKGSGSLTSILKEKDLANDIICSLKSIDNNSKLFLVKARVTEFGVSQVITVASYIMDYINMIKEVSSPDWVFKELQSMELRRFNFRQKLPDTETTSTLATLLQDESLPRKKILSSSLLETFNSTKISDFGKRVMKRENLRVIFSGTGKNSETLSKHEGIFGADYEVEDLSLVQNNIKFVFPSENRFLSSQSIFADKPETIYQHPVLLRDDSIGRLWFKYGVENIPKGYISIGIRNPAIQSSPTMSVMSTIFTKYIRNNLDDTIRGEMERSGLFVNFQPTYHGFNLTLGGTSDRMISSLRILLSKMENKINETEFNKIKADMLKSYENFRNASPSDQIGHYSYSLLNENSWNVEQKMMALSNLTFPKYTSFEPFGSVHYDCLVSGNFDVKQSESIDTLIRNTIARDSLSEEERVFGRSFVLNEGDSYHYIINNPRIDSSCIDYYIQTASRTDLRSRLTLFILTMLIDNMSHHELRTKESLGYLVVCGMKNMRTSLGFRVLVQSELPTDYVEYRIDEFLNKVIEPHIRNMSMDQFQNLVSTIREELNSPDYNTLSEEHNFYWNSIISGYFDFDSSQKLLEELDSISKKDLLYFYLYTISPNCPKRSKLVTHLRSTRNKENEMSSIIGHSIRNCLLENDTVISKDLIDNVIRKYEINDEPSRQETYNKYGDKIPPPIINERVLDVLSELRYLLSKEGRGEVVTAISSQVIGKLDRSYLALYPSGKNIEKVDQFRSNLMISKAPMPLRDLSEYKRR